jgi:hypothetical protein
MLLNHFHHDLLQPLLLGCNFRLPFFLLLPVVPGALAHPQRSQAPVESELLLVADDQTQLLLEGQRR